MGEKNLQHGLQEAQKMQWGNHFNKQDEIARHFSHVLIKTQARLWLIGHLTILTPLVSSKTHVLKCKHVLEMKYYSKKPYSSLPSTDFWAHWNSRKCSLQIFPQHFYKPDSNLVKLFIKRTFISLYIWSKPAVGGCGSVIIHRVNKHFTRDNRPKK